jgi:hypothetical protein
LAAGRRFAPQRTWRTFAGNLRENVAVERADEQFDDFGPDAGKAARQRVGAGGHDGAGFRGGKKAALADREVVQQVQLVPLQVRRQNACAA